MLLGHALKNKKSKKFAYLEIVPCVNTVQDKPELGFVLVEGNDKDVDIDSILIPWITDKESLQKYLDDLKPSDIMFSSEGFPYSGKDFNPSEWYIVPIHYSDKHAVIARPDNDHDLDVYLIGSGIEYAQADFDRLSGLGRKVILSQVIKEE